jgi:hypothetical protein
MRVLRELIFRTRPHRTFLREIVLEFCNAYRRIRLLNENNLHRCNVSPGFAFERNQCGHLVLNTRTRVRTSYMRRMLSIHPTASRADLYLLLHSLPPDLDLNREEEARAVEWAGSLSARSCSAE